MDPLSDLAGGDLLTPRALLDILLTSVLIYVVLRLIQGTRAVRLAIGATIVYAVYVVAQELDLRLLSGILQTGAVVGLVALVVVFQPELRRGLDRLGRVLPGIPVADRSGYQRIATELAAAAAKLSRRHTGALIVIERDTALGDMAETGTLVHGDLTAGLLASLFAPGYPLHDGAVIVSGDQIVAAAVMLPLAEREGSMEHIGTRHRAALGVTEQTDALAVVVSEESGAISLTQGGRIVRDLDEDELRQRLYGLLTPTDVGDAARRVSQRNGNGRGRTHGNDRGQPPAAEAKPSTPGTGGSPE
jgi:diadenylate cyclase